MPSSQISKKKLKAIVFTDIVDFTKLSADNEQKALEVIDRQRDLLKPIVLEHKGEWLKEIGDGLLFSFDSSLDAVNCSIKIQQALKDVDDFKIRIGIHQGDIFVKDGDVYGDDVNIASRVEGFSPEGGITISDKIYKDIQGVKEIKTSFIGHKPLKGVNQETKIRCITSNDLPQNKINFFPKLIGYGNLYIGILLTIIFSVLTIFTMLDAVKVFFPVESLTPRIISLCLVNFGLVMLLFGYSTLSFYKGISINSQKFIYYLGSLYFIFFIHFIFSGSFYVSDDEGRESNLINIIITFLIFLFPLILFRTFHFINKYIRSR